VNWGGDLSNEERSRGKTIALRSPNGHWLSFVECLMKESVDDPRERVRGQDCLFYCGPSTEKLVACLRGN
jgi:hypothetical protein